MALWFCYLISIASSMKTFMYPFPITNALRWDSSITNVCELETKLFQSSVPVKRLVCNQMCTLNSCTPKLFHLFQRWGGGSCPSISLSWLFPPPPPQEINSMQTRDLCANGGSHAHISNWVIVGKGCLAARYVNIGFNCPTDLMADTPND